MGSFATSNDWTFAESKMFEAALAAVDFNEANWLTKLAEGVPSKTFDQVSDHFLNLLLGIGASTESNTMENNYYNDNGYGANFNIPRVQEHNHELGHVFMEDNGVLPSTEELTEMATAFWDLDDMIRSPAHQAIADQVMNQQPAADPEVALNAPKVPAPAGPKKTPKKPRRKPLKGIGWNEQEQRLFLIGMMVYGKGDWRTIAQMFVKTRTPIQIASHAQKFFLRLEHPEVRRRKPSIHDIKNITAPPAFGTRIRSIYDTIDWPAVSSCYPTRMCNNAANNNDTSPLSQLKTLVANNNGTSPLSQLNTPAANNNDTSPLSQLNTYVANNNDTSSMYPHLKTPLVNNNWTSPLYQLNTPIGNNNGSSLLNTLAANNNGSSLLSQLNTLAANKNGEASSSFAETNFDLQAALEEPAAFGTYNCFGADGTGMDYMDEDETWGVSYLLRSPVMPQGY